MYIWAMLHNAATDRYHPIMFRWSPLPGGAEISPGVERYKSQGHHTAGFDTRAEAIADINESMAKVDSFGASKAIYEWDGEGIPAMVEFFDRSALMPALETAETA